MTFATLRALHTIIGDAISDIELVYAEQSRASASEHSPTPAPSPSPITPSTPDHPRQDLSQNLQTFHELAPEEYKEVLVDDGQGDGVSVGGLGAPFSPKGIKKSLSRPHLRKEENLSNILHRNDVNSPPPPPKPAAPTQTSPTTPSPPSSQRRLLRTWQSMAALSPSSKARKRRDGTLGRVNSPPLPSPIRANAPSPPPPVPLLPKPYHSTSKTSPSLSYMRNPHSASSRSSSSHFPSPPPPSSPPTPSTGYFDWRTRPNSLDFQPYLDFPSLDSVCDPSSPAELLNSTHPTVINAISRIVAASGQLAATVQSPFLTICDAVMQYHLPACMRLFEVAHVPEILREAGSDGLHVDKVAKRSNIDPGKLAHILRLLATHHILREVQPDVFALNRISSLVDTGKDTKWLLGKKRDGGGGLGETFTRDMIQRHRDGSSWMQSPEQKYEDTNGIAAFVGLCTDELFKSAAYMTEAYYLSDHTRFSREPTHAPFNFAFDTQTGFFGWLEGEDSGAVSPTKLGAELGPGTKTASMVISERGVVHCGQEYHPSRKSHRVFTGHVDEKLIRNANRFRLERFGKAMTGTASWEAPYAILHGFDWGSLPLGSTIVDVGGGIGSTSMLLADALSSRGDYGVDLGLKFVIQDRPVVVELGEKAWQLQRPELLENGTVQFQVHDFFTPQPIKNAAIYLLRVVLHDWPDSFARKILLGLRDAANEDTRLIIADFVLPMACMDDFKIPGLEDDSPIDAIGGGSPSLSQKFPKDAKEDVSGNMKTNRHPEGAEEMQSELAPAPLLANLGKANANAYWMDLTMQVTFNSQERTLREIVALARSSGWKVAKVSHAPGSLFGHIVAVPVPIPAESALANLVLANDSTAIKLGSNHKTSPGQNHHEVASRCGTPTFGSRMVLPSKDLLSRGTGKFAKPRGILTNGVAFGRCLPRASSATAPQHATPPSSDVPTTPKVVRKRPSPLAIPQSPSPRGPSSPRVPTSPSISRRPSSTNLHKHARSQSRISPVPAVPILSKLATSLVPRPRSATIGTHSPSSASRPYPMSPASRQVPPLPNLPPSLPNQVTQTASPSGSASQPRRTTLRRPSRVSLRQDIPRSKTPNPNDGYRHSAHVAHDLSCAENGSNGEFSRRHPH